MATTSIPISGLNNYTNIDPTDYVALVDSASMTTYRTPAQAMIDLIAASGSVPTASWASRSMNSETSSYGMKWHRTNTFTKPLSTTVPNAVNFFKVDGADPFGYSQGYVVNLKVFGYHSVCSKMYFLSNIYTSRGASSDRPWSGWYTARPLASAHRYPFANGAYLDAELEISHSDITLTHFRVRTSYNSVVDAQPTASITIMSFADQDSITNDDVFTNVDGEEASSNTLPSWDSAFVEIKDYRMTVSGSILVGEGVTGSLSGTSSWAISASWAPMPQYAVSASWASSSLHSQTSVSASWASASLTASYALAIPSTGPTSIAGIVPVGTIVDYAGTTISDTNWALCDGSEVLIASYPTLATVLGTTWGTATAGYVKLPDLRKRLCLGAKGALSDNQFSNANPAVGGSMLSGSVGNTGGGEAYQYHYHIMSQHYLKINNDDYDMNYIGYNKALSTYHMYPARQTQVGYPPPSNRWFPLYLITGDSTGRTQPVGYGTATTANSYPMLATSFGVSETNNWFTCAAYPNDWQRSKWFGSAGTTTANYDRNDLSMPYAVTNKIIRVL